MNTNPRILYVVSFYGSPPLNYLSKYITESTTYMLDVIKLPAVSLSKNGFVYEAFLLDNTGFRKTVKIRSSMKLPSFCIYILQYVFNTYATFKLVLGRGKYDLGIGESSFGSFVMFIYKTLGRVKKTVFMSGDVLPIFDRKILPCYFHSNNVAIKVADRLFVRVQLFLRKMGVKNDVVWYANQQIRGWDLDNGLVARSYFIAPAVTIDKNEALEKLTTKRVENSLVYIGRLDEDAGVDISLEALALIIGQMPDINITFVGGNEVSVEKYRKLAEQLGVVNNVDFKGYIEKSSDAMKVISRGKIGLALYKPKRENVSMYADVSKPKEYIGAGLPVIMTKGGPSLGMELQDLGAIILTKYDPADIASAIVEILNNKSKYNNLLKGVAHAAQRYDYRENFRSVFENIQNSPNK